MVTVIWIFAMVCQAKSFAVFGYLPEWRYHALSFESVSRHVTHIIFFSLEMNPLTGKIKSMDRFPSEEILAKARANNNGAKFYICFGGNGRSDGFKLVHRKDARHNFVKGLLSLVQKHNLDGVDYNWEYPGYSFRNGYADADTVHKDYLGLFNLVKESREAFDKHAQAQRKQKRLGISLAYYPDSRQEKLLLKYGIQKYVDYMHMMTYDQHGQQHSSYDFAVRSISQGIELGLPPSKLTLGLPFYGRDSHGQWTTYEEILNKHYDLIGGRDGTFNVDIVRGIGFNSFETIKKKTEYAIQKGIGGVMIWEIGQDCRMKSVKELNGNTHAATCKGKALSTSLHVAISKARPHSLLQSDSEEL